jgi:microcystin-dependent protein
VGIIVLPKTLTAHTDAVAADVMANFNKLLALVNGQLDSENIAASLRQRLWETGDLKLTARAAAPEGWLLCDGAAVSRSTYAALFAAIGTTYGAGNGTTTFNLPDYRGRVPLGVDGAAGRLSANDALGNVGGAETVTMTEAQMPLHHHFIFFNTGGQSQSHAHTLPFFTQNRHEGSGFAYSSVDPGGNTIGSFGNNVDHVHLVSGDTDSRGGGQAHPNLQPYQVCNVLIKI